MSVDIEAPDPAPSLGRIAARGFAWIILTTAGAKIFTAIGQLIVAGLLLPKDFGVVALAYSVTAFTTILQKNGLREILVQRGSQFSSLASTAFWMSLATGLLVGLLTIAAAPLGAHIYGVPQVSGALLVLAMSAPFLALQSVPGAMLQHDLRFRGIAIINVSEAFATTGMTVILALMGFGPYSIVLPAPIVQALSLVAQLMMTRFRPEPKIDWNAARGLLRDSSLMLGAAALFAFNMQGASIVLGLFHTVAIVGVYFFAANLVAQVTGLIVNNLWTVLLPSFSRLQEEPDRQLDAFLRTTKTVSLAGMPICLLLATIAQPMLRLLYHDRWLDAVPVLRILSVGACFSISFSLAINLMTAQGRYRELFILNSHRAVVFLLLITTGAFLDGAAGVAVGSALFAAIYGPLTTFVAIRKRGGNWNDALNIIGAPFGVAALSCVVAFCLVYFIPFFHRNEITQIVSNCIFLGAILPFLANWLLKSTWREFIGRLKSLRVRSH